MMVAWADEVDTFLVYFVGTITGFQNELDVWNNKNGNFRDYFHISNLNKG